MEELLVTVEDAVATLTMNRPHRMNALSKDLQTGIARTVAALDGDDRVRVLILTGAGDRAFTAGLDLKELAEDPGAVTKAMNPGGADDPVEAIERCGKPVIAAINGLALTGGFELALACDVLLASTAARFADTHTRVSLIPGWGLSQKLSRLIGPYRAKELSLTGNFVDAATALAWGIVNRVVAPAELMAAARALAADMATVEPAFMRSYKGLIDEGYQRSFGDARRLEAERTVAANRAKEVADFEANRGAVQARGRRQG